ncbi:MAG TPA: hypothetical protein VMR97_06395 [Acidimicrobiales bacterium]|nr:hypothetical protein [Acidimicrobiales bacterium]
MSDERTQMLEPAEGLLLEIPEEPEELRVHLRAKALEDADSGEASYEVCFGAWIWERWRAALEAKGLSREALMEIVAAYRRELWFWLLAERRWEPLLEGLAGRVSRRLPGT